VALQRAEMKMVKLMCDVKVKDRVPSNELRETRIRWYYLSATAKQQVAMVWACAAKRTRIGDEMYGAWSGGC